MFKKRIIFLCTVLLAILLMPRANSDNGQVSPLANLSQNSTAVLNNNSQILQNGINGLFSFFSQYFTNGKLNPANGGTGQDSTNWTSGDLVYMSSRGVWNHASSSSLISSLPVLSNVLFQYNGSADSNSEISNAATTTVNTGGGYRYFWGSFTNSSFTVLSLKFIKISGINTVTVYSKLWSLGGGSGSYITVTIGALGALTLTADTSSVPKWYSGTINVSSLTNGTAYDVVIALGSTQNNNSYMSNIVGFGS